MGELNIIRCFAGVRPYGPDSLPVVGPAEGIPGLFVASGLGGDGIALSTVVGSRIASMVAGEPVDDDVRPFLPSRFAT